jgi:hypothetical protein
MRSAILFLLFVISALAEQPEPTPTPEPTPGIDPRVHLRVKFPTAQREFHIGEVIPIQLFFSSDAGKTFELDEASYDRSGRMNYEHFQITPAKGWLDPIPPAVFSIVGGGLTNTEYLTRKPWGVQLNLNEWVRFDEPGEYALTVFSHRLSVFNGASEYGSSGVTAKSNEIKFKVAPADATWQKRTLDQAIATLSKPQVSSEQEDVAWSVLRYLGTPEAAVGLAKGLGTKRAHIFGSDPIYGLIASPAREAAREAVEKEIANPDRAIDDTFLFTLQWLYLGADPTPEEQNAARAKAVQQLIAALPTKRRAALGSSLAQAFDEVSTKQSTPPKLVAKLRDEIVELFDQLDLDEQVSLLSRSNWEKIRSPALVPSLKKLATAKAGELKKREEDFWSANDISALALQRWYDLAPEEARPYVLQEITKSIPRYGGRALSFLPDKSLPEVDEKLADNLLHLKNFEGMEQIVSLIVRYATSAPYPKVVKTVDAKPGLFGRGWSARIFAYLLKINPTETEARMEKTLSVLRNDDFAYDPDFFGTIAQVYYDPVLEQVALRHLNDPRIKLEMAAVRMLGTYGSAAAEQPLLKRYEKWNREWSEKVSRDRNIISNDSPLHNQGTLGDFLFEALANGQGWSYGPIELQRLKEINKISTFQAKAEALKESWGKQPFSVSISVTDDHFFGHVAQYKTPTFELLKQKLVQFPAGTTFTLNFYDNQEKKERDLLEDVRRFLRERGYSVTDEKH